MLLTSMSFMKGKKEQMKVPSTNGNNIYQLSQRSRLNKFLLHELVRRLIERVHGIFNQVEESRGRGCIMGD
jgi:hypothetical protein